MPSFPNECCQTPEVCTCLGPMETLRLPVGFAVEYLDGALADEPDELLAQWQIVRTELMALGRAMNKIGTYTPVSHIQPVLIARAALKGEAW